MFSSRKPCAMGQTFLTCALGNQPSLFSISLLQIQIFLLEVNIHLVISGRSSFYFMIINQLLYVKIMFIGGE